ncbi:MAG: alpha/beta hydrolase [Shewanella sp.]|nr:alpha/beta hydrolase [Shewanella sp.]MCF1430764.1 alpha/beta hydrolase [Shewanella sp.]MCF1439468.1 alpha/beta hydrolase [Shewanella sp.]MCF1457552.1 alpha/beta hydrolase [Shewanella sp.]
MSSIVQKSLFLPYRQGQLHLRQVSPANPNDTYPPVLMLHGAMSNGRVFYSQSGKGLACFLARAGFNVYVLDTAGRGLSTPKLGPGFDLGQSEVIVEQLPLVQEYILSRHQQGQVHWCAHSWGGVLMLSCFVRCNELRRSVASILTFGTKRAIRTRSLKKWLMVDLVWNRIAPALARRDGYFAADKWRMGMDNESRASLQQSIEWVRGDWRDEDDAFDYQAAAADLAWPACWFIAGCNDTVLGNPADVQRTMAECRMSGAKYTLLARAAGYKHDYDHAGMLTHMDAESDHFLEVLDWYLSQNVCGLR